MNILRKEAYVSGPVKSYLSSLSSAKLIGYRRLQLFWEHAYTVRNRSWARSSVGFVNAVKPVLWFKSLTTVNDEPDKAFAGEKQSRASTIKRKWNWSAKFADGYQSLFEKRTIVMAVIWIGHNAEKETYWDNSDCIYQK